MPRQVTLRHDLAARQFAASAQGNGARGLALAAERPVRITLGVGIEAAESFGVFALGKRVLCCRQQSYLRRQFGVFAAGGIR
jgi:threonine dehydratase